MANGKPGVMIYFETGKAIKDLDYETKGRLFEAIMEYAETGASPAFDGVLSAIWPFIVSSIDRDSASYADKVIKRKRAIYSRWWKEYAAEYGLDPNDKEARERWIDKQMNTNDTNVSDVLQTIPTTTPSPTSTSTPTSTAAPSSGMRRRGGNVFLDLMNEGM